MSKSDTFVRANDFHNAFFDIRLEVDWAIAFAARCSLSPSRLSIVNTPFGYDYTIN